MIGILKGYAILALKGAAIGVVATYVVRATRLVGDIPTSQSY